MTRGTVKQPTPQPVPNSVPGARFEPGSTPRMLGNETAKGLLIWWSNRATILPELLVQAGLFLILQYLLGGGRIIPELVVPTMLAFIPYVFAYLLVVKLVAGITEELQAGTLEQMHLSPLPAWLLSVGRLGSVLVQAITTTVLLGVGYVVGFNLTMDISLAWQWQALVPTVLLVVDVAGFALLLGALALTVPTVGAVTHVILSLIMLVNGAFVPISAFPDWLQTLARLAPTTLGVEVNQSVLLDGQPLQAAWSNGNLSWLLAHAAASLVAGWTLWQWNIRRGLRHGKLGPQ